VRCHVIEVAIGCLQMGFFSRLGCIASLPNRLSTGALAFVLCSLKISEAFSVTHA
jgi:hypothetical protein